MKVDLETELINGMVESLLSCAKGDIEFAIEICSDEIKATHNNDRATKRFKKVLKLLENKMANDILLNSSEE